jgi:hypothetical protein
MDRKEFLKAFSELTPEDQAAVRAEFLGKGTPETGSACCPEGMKEPMRQMMEMMQSGGGPMAMCQEMMEKMGGKRC